jgi:RNA polymerase sigma-70 factor (ECF subfamily)
VVDDQALLARWRDGDRKAGSALFERYFLSVNRFFKSKVRPDLAEDLIQRTFLGCVKGIARFRGDASFRTYLFTIARNELYMHFRRAGASRGEALDTSVQSVIDLRTGVSTALSREDERHVLRLALQHLPVETQTLLELAYWEELSVAELAGIFEVSPVTIRTRQFRAREKLREAIEQLQAPGAAAIVDLDAAAAAAGRL